MAVVQQNIPVTMVRPNLDGIPVAALPAGYAVTWYAAGDERHWIEIHRRADRYNSISLARFARAFGGDTAILGQRQAYLRDPADAVIGTATAWFDDVTHDPQLGRVHWVAIDPAYQGRGLAKPLLSVICRRLADLGHQQAYLTTSTARVPAINLYRQFGFVPRVRDEQERAVWQALAPYLR
jgi:GNAT superfamily N-acetyltransferase